MLYVNSAGRGRGKRAAFGGVIARRAVPVAEMTPLSCRRWRPGHLYGRTRRAPGAQRVSRRKAASAHHSLRAIGELAERSSAGGACVPATRAQQARGGSMPLEPGGRGSTSLL